MEPKSRRFRFPFEGMPVLTLALDWVTRAKFHREQIKKPARPNTNEWLKPDSIVPPGESGHQRVFMKLYSFALWVGLDVNLHEQFQTRNVFSTIMARKCGKVDCCSPAACIVPGTRQNCFHFRVYYPTIFSNIANPAVFESDL